MLIEESYSSWAESQKDARTLGVLSSRFRYRCRVAISRAERLPGVFGLGW
jgi:hypothetical protein